MNILTKLHRWDAVLMVYYGSKFSCGRKGPELWMCIPTAKSAVLPDDLLRFKIVPKQSVPVIYYNSPYQL